MKFNFTTAKVLAGNALRTLGITESLGKTLAADQKEAIQKAYGKAFTEKFEASLNAEDPETFVADMQAAMKEFFAPEAAATTAGIAEELRGLQAENERLQLEGSQQRQTIATLIGSVEETPQAQIPAPQNTLNTSPMRINANAPHYTYAQGYLANGVASGTPTIEVSELRQEFGTYLSQNGNNLEVIRQIFNGFTSSKHFKTVPATTEYRAIQSHINSVVQQFKPKWTPKGNTKFTPIVIKNYRHKINVPIVPSEVIDSYMFHLYDEGLTPAQMPISKYIINQLILPKILDDIELRMIFKGKYVESLNDEATPAEDSMDGIETILVREKENPNTRINFYKPSIDYLTATPKQIVDHINGFADFVDEKLKIKKICASKMVKVAYQRAYEAVYSGGTKVIGGMNKEAEVDYVEMNIVEMDGMAQSPILIATVPDNMVKLRHKNEAPNVVNKIVEMHYSLDIVGEFWLGAGFPIAEALFANVPDNYDPQASLNPDNQFPDGTAPSESSAGSGAGGL